MAGTTTDVLRVEIRPRWAFALPLRNGLDGLTRIRRGVLQRLLHAAEQPVLVHVVQPAKDRVVFAARANQRGAAEWGIERMRLALGVDQDLRAFHDRFRFDPLIGRALRAKPTLRAPGRPDPFEALVWAICGQLIDVERAATIQRRLVARLGRRCPLTGMRDAPTADVLARQAPALLASFDLSAGRATAVVRAAREVAADRVDLHGPDHERAWQRLRAIRGIGNWTVQMLALTGQGRLDQIPAADVAFLKLVGRLQTGNPYARATEAEVVDRLKSDHPATFEEALEAYRDAMLRSRAYLIEHDIVTVPPDERIDVVATPDYLRNVVPFAAYFSPPKFDPSPKGIYIVTPSVGNDPNAMREHSYSSISNTSIHEAYPGHHLQLHVANAHPSLTRLMTDAPEFTEGWGMYSEQLMREEGFDAAPNFRVNMHTDAIWRACRIILDVRMHRGEIGVDEALRFLVGQTSFEEANARAEVRRYTYTPTYQLSYLLGKVLLLGLRDDEKRRLGAAFSLRDFHDALLRNGSLPISFHRRILAAQNAADGAPRTGAGAGGSAGGPGGASKAARR